MTDVDIIFSRWKGKWVIAILELFILWVMDKQPRYGRELITLSKENFGEKIKIPTIYGMLTRLVQLDLIHDVDKRSQEGVTRGTSRRYYALTDKGHEYLSLLIREVNESQFSLEFIPIKLLEVNEKDD